MDENFKFQLFEDQRIRMAWDEENEDWLLSIVDVVGVLTEQPTQRGASNYWAKLKERLKDEGANQLLTNCQQLKMTAEDGKKRLTDVGNTEQILRRRAGGVTNTQKSRGGIHFRPNVSSNQL